MRTSLNILAASALLFTASASAQVTGGGGGSLGGTVGGALGQGGGVGGTVGGTLGGNVGGNIGGNVGGISANGGLSGTMGADVNVNSRSGGFDASSAVALNARTAASVEPGTVVRDLRGRVVGRVRAVQTAAGRVRALAVEVGDRLVALPVANFRIAGDALVSAMTRADIRRQARQQEAQRQENGRQQTTSRQQPESAGGNGRGSRPRNVDEQKASPGGEGPARTLGPCFAR